MATDFFFKHTITWYCGKYSSNPAWIEKCSNRPTSRQHKDNLKHFQLPSALRQIHIYTGVCICVCSQEMFFSYVSNIKGGQRTLQLITCDIDTIWTLTPHFPLIVAPSSCSPLVTVTFPSCTHSREERQCLLPVSVGNPELSSCSY